LHGIKMMVFPRIFLGLITLKLEDLTFKAHWLESVPPVLRTEITRSAHTVFMCFVFISEQTTIFALYYTNW
jgi:hypothetical protein